MTTEEFWKDRAIENSGTIVKVPPLSGAKCPYRPLEFNVVVELDPAETVTKGGIILTAGHTEREQLSCEEGTLVAISPHAFSYVEDWGEAPKPQVGQRVMIRRYDGLLREKEIDGAKRAYRIVQDKSVVALIEE